MRLYRIELRRSPLLWCLPVLVLLDVTVLFGRHTWWIGIWPEASAAAQLPAYFFGLVLGGGAAWASGRVHRAGIANQLKAAAVPAWRADALLLAASLTYGLAAYLPGVILAAVVSTPIAGPGFLWPSYLLLGASMVVLCASIGHLAGKLSASRFVPPLVVAVCMFGMMFTRQLFELYVLSAPVQVEVSPAALTARGVLAVLLAVLAVTLPRAGHVPGWGVQPSTVSAIGTAALMAGFFLVLLAGPLRTDRPVPAQQVCSSSSPQVCLWPESRKYVEPMAAMAARLAALPEDVIKVPEVIYEAGLRGGLHSGEVLRIEGDASVPGDLALAVQGESLEGCLPPPDREEEYYNEVFTLIHYLTLRAMGPGRTVSPGAAPPGVDGEKLTVVARSDEAKQSKWVREQVKTIKAIGGCG
jgi:hypothetical protein